MRAVWLILLVFVAPTASAGFGSGAPVFENLVVEGTNSAPEPTVGIPWNTDSVFYHAGSTTIRIRFGDDGAATFEDVSPAYQLPINLDPLLHADPDTGRIWAGGLHGPCSVMMISDDDGETWVPAGDICSGKDFDHQSIGSGPHSLAVQNPGHPHAAYYCAQFGTISCSYSPDGGTSWIARGPVAGPCGGFNGHIRVSRATTMVGVPVADCSGDHGLITTSDSGLTWEAKTIPGSGEWTNGFDPSLQFSRPSGWMYYGMASEHGIHIAMTKDDAATWETLGKGAGGAGAAWLDVGQFHDPPIVAGTFADVQVGDDDRVAFSFIGLEGGPDADLEYLNSNEIYACDERQEELVWHYYVALSYDAGQTWTVDRISEDPVQFGGVYDSVVASDSGACRNLLDFNDMDIDSQGRIYIAYADGCTGDCPENGPEAENGYRAQAPRMFRQVAGPGLFAAFDAPPADMDTDGDGIPNDADEDIDGDGIPNAEEPDADGDGVPDADEEPLAAATPGPGLVLIALTMAVLVALRRR